ncbi:hypothetical protein GGR53DRAFT_493999 [Hypoxylon sp. FL1150]|nr:hypothetical protein GGR53DRAFT_493999 [Hypoxylon sp. FL1150]
MYGMLGCDALLLLLLVLLLLLALRVLLQVQLVVEDLGVLLHARYLHCFTLGLGIPELLVKVEVLLLHLVAIGLHRL